jgi:hypothetical protein
MSDIGLLDGRRKEETLVATIFKKGLEWLLLLLLMMHQY